MAVQIFLIWFEISEIPYEDSKMRVLHEKRISTKLKYIHYDDNQKVLFLIFLTIKSLDLSFINQNYAISNHRSEFNLIENHSRKNDKRKKPRSKFA